MSIKIDVIENACDVYGPGGKNSPIEINFYEINVNNFDSGRYAKNINYTIDCGSQNVINPNLKLKFESEPADFNSNFVRTTNPNVGLKIVSDGVLLPPKEYKNFNLSNKPSLVVYPVLNTEEDIELGLFEATGVLKVEYQ
ncbi:fimbrial protein [Providencia rettgeri]|uniref:fimbrial protein n=1 Tax=Providencia rettgeri TaxID=587 RepID=UPI0035252FBE